MIIAPLASKLTLDSAGFRDGMTSADRATSRFTASMEAQAERFGKTKGEAKLLTLAQRGASEETLAAARASVSQIAALERQADALKRAAQITEAATSKEERYGRETLELKQHLQAGRITQEVYNRTLLETAEKYDISRRSAMRLLPVQDRIADSARRAGRGLASMGSGAVGIGRNLASMGAIAGGVAAAGLAAMIAVNSDVIDKTVKVADALGIQTEKLIGLRYAADLAGTDNETFDKSLQRMVKGIGEAAQGTGTAAIAFEQLDLPLDALMAMKPDEQFAAIADAMNGVENQTSKVAMATQIFGREGASLINTLNLGSEGLAANQAEAEALGLAYSRVDAAKVEAANDAISRTKAAVGAVGTQLTVALAPYIEAASNQLLGMATSGEGMGSRVSAAVGWVSSAVAYAADFLELPKAAFYGLQSVVTGGLALMADGIQGLIDAQIYLLNLLPGIEIEASRVAGMFADEAWNGAAEAGEKAQEAWDRFQGGANSAAVSTFIAEVQAKADAAAQAVAAAGEESPGLLDAEGAAEDVAKIDDELMKLQQQLDRFGKSSIDIKLLDLAEAGAGVEQLDRARASMEQLARLERDAERRKGIDSTLEGIEQRVRTFGLTEEQKTLLDLEAAGATDEQLARAEEAFRQLADLESRQEGDDPAAGRDADRTDNNVLRAGSAEAQLAAFRASRASGGSPELDETKRQTTLQERMASSLERLEKRSPTTTSEVIDF